MKTILILSTLIAVPAFANWVSVSDLNGARYGKEMRCKTASGGDCVYIGSTGKGDFKDPRWHDVQTSNVDDMDKPIWKAKYDIINCDSPAHCAGSEVGGNPANACTTPDERHFEKNDPPIPGYSSYCTGITGYEQKEVKTLVENSSNKTTFEAQDAQKAQIESDIEQMQKHVAFGQKMIAYIGARNKSKTPALTTAQVKTIVETYSTIHALLGSGSLVTAKSEIEALTVNDPLVTQADKDAILAEINAYLGL